MREDLNEASEKVHRYTMAREYASSPVEQPVTQVRTV